MNDGYLQNYSQDVSMPPMISPSSNQSGMPMMNMMMPPNLSQVQYNPYGYNIPQSGSGSGFGQASPAFQYSTQYAYPPPPPQEQEQQMQQQIQAQQQQQQTNQQYLPLPPTAASFFRNADAKASSVGVNVLLMSSLSQSSSDELPTESVQLDLLPTKKIKSPNRPGRSQLDNEQNAHESRERR
mmetsp:Transcript_24099/g.37790  ORF Transcript_24099/g.37790 Transcript_24099/m.37790 type:complete len:183 (+) Transcript_24099:3-551(+)